MAWVYEPAVVWEGMIMAIKLCVEGHDQVCYESEYCPVCSVTAESDNLEQELSEANERIEELEAKE